MYTTCPACSARLDQQTQTCPRCGANLAAGDENRATRADEVDQAIRETAVVAHLSTLAGLVVPFGSVIGPLAVWLTRRDRDPFIDDAGREALNFGISIAVYGLVVLVAAVDAGRHPAAHPRGDRLGGAGVAGGRKGQPGPVLPIPADHAVRPLIDQAHRPECAGAGSRPT